MGKQDFPHSDRDAATPAKGLLERASDIFDFGGALKGQGLPPLAVPQELIPPPPVYTPAPVAQTSAPGIAPRPRAADWTGPVQKLDRDVLGENGFIVPGAPITGLAEEFRIIKRELQAGLRSEGSPHEDGRVVLVASAHPGDGKTFCAVNLALSLAAESNIEVLLVDGDVAKPDAPRVLGLEVHKGLLDVLADPALRVEDYVIRTDVPGLSVLPAGTGTTRDGEFLASAQMDSVIAALVSGRPERIVIIDSAPLLAASAASILAAHVDLTLLVVRADRTSETALRDAAELLNGCRNVQLMLNGVKFSASGRRFGTYYGREG
ncbi:tyrosine-protein kinase family protein [Sphingobium fluviale]|uniref:Exopolysaccharide biosynthesis protein n=1 Tax=Sphingobium fluviale TaxID=2506423 RepID=A0A4Q1KMJ8_9SPHN|nr:CpsD/CapB family tyrosine-protein kinase [Sphingobium fluviale]RXR31017.1 exopolysaccharide biosynthesis protein [Sphingobium fluviale]